MICIKNPNRKINTAIVRKVIKINIIVYCRGAVGI